jgi:hypothetical protein
MLQTQRLLALAAVVTVAACGGSETARDSSGEPAPTGVAILAIAPDAYSGEYRLERRFLGRDKAPVRLTPMINGAPQLTELGDGRLAWWIEGKARPEPQVVDIRSGRVRPLPQRCRGPEIVVTYTCVSENNDGQTLRVRGISSSSTRIPIRPRLTLRRGELLGVSPFALSQDRRHLAFEAETFSGEPGREIVSGAYLYVLDVSKRKTVRLHSGGDYEGAFDSSGRWFAYSYNSSSDPADAFISIVDLRTFSTRRVENRGSVTAWAGPIAWSPSRPILVYAFKDRLMAFDVRSGKRTRLHPRLLGDFVHPIAGFSRDGERLAYIDSVPARTLHVVTLDGTQRWKLNLSTAGDYIERVWVSVD